MSPSTFYHFYSHMLNELLPCVPQESEEYKAKMAAERMEMENQKARQRNKELVQLQMEAEAKKEALRRATEEEIQVWYSG